MSYVFYSLEIIEIKYKKKKNQNNILNYRLIVTIDNINLKIK